MHKSRHQSQNSSRRAHLIEHHTCLYKYDVAYRMYMLSFWQATVHHKKKNSSARMNSVPEINELSLIRSYTPIWKISYLGNLRKSILRSNFLLYSACHSSDLEPNSHGSSCAAYSSVERSFLTTSTESRFSSYCDMVADTHSVVQLMSRNASPTAK